MNRTTLVAGLLGLLLAIGGLVLYVQWSGPARSSAAAEDCEDTPPPNEFAMAAECEAGDASSPAGREPAAPAPAAGSR